MHDPHANLSEAERNSSQFFKMQLFKDILFFNAWADDIVIGRAVVPTLVEVVEFSEAILLWLTFACVADDIVSEITFALILVTLVEFSEAKRPTRTCERETSVLKVLPERLREGRLGWIKMFLCEMSVKL